VMGSALNLPEWATSFVAFLLILGFPVVLVFSWAYELTPGGIDRTKSIALSDSIARIAGRKLDVAIIGALILALGFVVIDNYVLENRSGELAGMVTGVLPNSVAVLLCNNLSPDPDDAYFAASIHEQILNQLVRIQDLNVIARTSVLQYAESTPPIPRTAEKLNVETVMECSVRYAGDAILVTAQLINPETNSHLWSETYPGDLSDLSTAFAMQADIAMNIANALQAEFSLAEQESIEKIQTVDRDAYALYLRALSTPNRDSRHAALNQAIQLDPEFALAYSARAFMDTGRLIGVVTNTTPDEALDLGLSIIADVQRALEYDPTLGRAQAALAIVHQANWRGARAEEAFQSALELSSNDIQVLWRYGEFKRFRGEYDQSIRWLQRAIELDPNELTPYFELAITYREAGNWVAAAELWQDVTSREPDLLGTVGTNVNGGFVEAVRGNISEAVRRHQLAEELRPLPAYRLASIAQAYALAGRPDDAARIFADFEEQATQGGIGDGWWALAYVAVGDYGQALQRRESAVDTRVTSDQVALVRIAANSWGDPELDGPEFRELLDCLWLD